MSDAVPWSRRLAAIAVSAAAIALLVATSLPSATRWLVTGSGSGFGLRTFSTCSAHGCDLRPTAEILAAVEAAQPGLVKSGFLVAGSTTAIAIWAAAGLLGLALLPLLAGVRSGLSRTASRLALLGLVVALAGAVVFVLRRPGGASGTAYQLGFSFWMFGAGNVLGLIAGQMVARLHAPADPG